MKFLDKHRLNQLQAQFSSGPLHNFGDLVHVRARVAIEPWTRPSFPVDVIVLAAPAAAVLQALIKFNAN